VQITSAKPLKSLAEGWLAPCRERAKRRSIEFINFWTPSQGEETPFSQTSCHFRGAGPSASG